MRFFYYINYYKFLFNKINYYKMESYLNEDYEGIDGIITNMQLNLIYKQMGGYICLINDINENKATGFFCKIPYPDDFNLLPTLISNSEILNKNNTQLNKTIKLNIYDEKDIKREYYLLIDSSRKVFIDESLGITIMEIKKEDKIDKIFDIDENINKENYIEIYKRRPQIYTLYFSNDKNAFYSNGYLNQIVDNKIQYYCKAVYTPGVPIISLPNYKIIGVHTRTIKSQNNRNYNEGIFIKFLIEKFKTKFPIKNNNNFLFESNKNTMAIINQNFKSKNSGNNFNKKIENNKHYISKNQIENYINSNKNMNLNNNYNYNNGNNNKYYNNNNNNSNYNNYNNYNNNNNINNNSKNSNNNDSNNNNFNFNNSNSNYDYNNNNSDSNYNNNYNNNFNNRNYYSNNNNNFNNNNSNNNYNNNNNFNNNNFNNNNNNNDNNNSNNNNNFNNSNNNNNNNIFNNSYYNKRLDNNNNNNIYNNINNSNNSNNFIFNYSNELKNFSFNYFNKYNNNSDNTHNYSNNYNNKYNNNDGSKVEKNISNNNDNKI